MKGDGARKTPELGATPDGSLMSNTDVRVHSTPARGIVSELAINFESRATDAGAGAAVAAPAPPAPEASIATGAVGHRFAGATRGFFDSSLTY